MKINVIIADGLRGRAARLYGAPLAHHLARRGCEAQLILLHRHWAEARARRFEAERGVAVVYAGQALDGPDGGGVLRQIAATRALLRTMLEGKPDVNVICDLHPASVAAARLARLLRGTPMVLAAESLPSAADDCRAKRTQRFFERLAARSCAAMAAHDRQLAETLSEMSRGRNRAVFVPPAVEPSLYRASGPGIEAMRESLGIEDRPVAACIGKTGESELRALMNMFAAVVRRVPAAVLLLAGVGEAGNPREYARRIGMADNARFAGPTTAANCGRYIAAADVVLDPTGDAAGRILPAMYFGRPVLAMGGQDIPWILGGGGIAVRPGATRDFEQALYLTLVDRRLRTKMGRMAAQRARRHFLWEDLAERWVELIFGAAAGSPEGRPQEPQRRDDKIRRKERVLS